MTPIDVIHLRSDALAVVVSCDNDMPEIMPVLHPESVLLMEVLRVG